MRLVAGDLLLQAAFVLDTVLYALYPIYSPFSLEPLSILAPISVPLLFLVVQTGSQLPSRVIEIRQESDRFRIMIQNFPLF